MIRAYRRIYIHTQTVVTSLRHERGSHDAIRRCNRHAWNSKGALSIQFSRVNAPLLSFLSRKAKRKNQTIVEKKKIVKDRGRIEDFLLLLLLFFRRRKMRRRGEEGAKRSWHYERSFGRKNDPLGGVILIMRVDRRLCGRALFSFSPCLRADKRVSIVRLRVRLFLPFACETTGRRG